MYDNEIDVDIQIIEEPTYDEREEQENAIIEERLMKQYDGINFKKLQLVATKERTNMKGITKKWFIYIVPNTNIVFETNGTSSVFYKR